jgi:hypothetical protein
MKCILVIIITCSELGAGSQKKKFHYFTIYGITNNIIIAEWDLYYVLTGNLFRLLSETFRILHNVHYQDGEMWEAELGETGCKHSWKTSA